MGESLPIQRAIEMAWYGGVSKFNNPGHHKSICYDTWAESHHPGALSLSLSPPAASRVSKTLLHSMLPRSPTTRACLTLEVQRLPGIWLRQ